MAAPKKERCLRGHKRNDINTYIDSKGFAQCRECLKIRNDKYRERKKAAGFKLIKGRWRR